MALGGLFIARSMKITPERVRTFLHDTDLTRLTGEARTRALVRLASMWNALTLEERKLARASPDWRRWFAAMTDEEKASFLESTLPSGFNQMMTAFEQMPPERRRKAIEDSVRRLREARETAADEGDPAAGTDAPPSIPRAVQERVVQAGLKSFYDSGSTQLKSEMAPLLEELQRSMESGRLFREPRRPRPDR